MNLRFAFGNVWQRALRGDMKKHPRLKANRYPQLTELSNARGIIMKGKSKNTLSALRVSTRERPTLLHEMRIDQVLLDFAKQYYARFVFENPGAPITEEDIVVHAMVFFEVQGYAIRTTDSDGNMTWTATSKFLSETRLERGPVVTLLTHYEP
jgi:hypothetical protein